MVDAKLYDGVTAHPHDVRVEFSDNTLTLRQESGWSDSVNADILKRIDASPSLVRLGRTDQPGWRLILPPDTAEQVRALLGREERYGRWIDRVGLAPALAIGAVITASVVALGFLAPHWLAPHVPMSWERNVGSAIVGDFGTCAAATPTASAR